MKEEEKEKIAQMLAFISGEPGWKNITEEKKEAYRWGAEQISNAFIKLGYRKPIDQLNRE